MYSENNAQKGFSLIELLIVMIIMGLLASLVGPRLFGKLGTAKVKTAQSQIALLMTSLDTYRLDMGSYPPQEKGLGALFKDETNSTKWDGPYLVKDMPNDPWDRPYIYKNPSEHGEIEIVSFGADGKEGGKGENADIGSWE